MTTSSLPAARFDDRLRRTQLLLPENDASALLIGWGTDLNYDEIAQHPYNPSNFLPLFRSGWERRKPVDQL